MDAHVPKKTGRPAKAFWSHFIMQEGKTTKDKPCYRDEWDGE